MGYDYATYVALEVGFPLAIVCAFLLGSTLFMIVLVFLKYRIPPLQGLYHSMYSSLLRYLGLFYEGQTLEEMENGSYPLLTGCCSLIFISCPLSFVAVAFSNAFLFRVVFSCAPGFDCFSQENGTFPEPMNCSNHEELKDVAAVICYQFAFDSFKGIVAFGGSVVCLWVLCKCVRQANLCCSVILFYCLLTLVLIFAYGELWVWGLTHRPFVGKIVLAIFALLCYFSAVLWLFLSPYKQRHQSQLGRSEESGGNMVGMSLQGSGTSASTSTERQPLLSTSNL